MDCSQFLLNQMINSPQMQELVKKYGSLEQAFYSICKERNIDPNAILKQIKGINSSSRC